MSSPSHLNAQPLVWGHGPRTLEVFLEPTCPFSVRAFNKLDEKNEGSHSHGNTSR